MNEHRRLSPGSSDGLNNDEELTNLYVLDENLDVYGKIENLAPEKASAQAKVFGRVLIFCDV